MKLFRDKEPFLTKEQKFKIFMLLTLLIIGMYCIALTCSLCGLKTFICDYHNNRLHAIEIFLRSHKIYALATASFMVFESYIVVCFVRRKIMHFAYPLILYAIIVGLGFLNLHLPSIVYTAIAMSSCLIIPIIDMAICEKKVRGKSYLFCLIRFAIGIGFCLFYQLFIYGIKSGMMRYTNGIYSLESTFNYNLEYYIALIISFLFMNLFFEGKGDNEKWTTFQAVGSSSQISKKKSQRLNLSKKQQKKIKRLYFRILLVQAIGFTILMVLPFLLGKLFEFLTLYFSFAIARAFLGFKYSLHYRKESTCIFVGVVVFGIMTLVIPFFDVNVIGAVVEGVVVAILLHLSYKYRGMWLFMQVANRDRYADLFVFFNANTEYTYIRRMAKHYGVKDEFKQNLLADYMTNFKLSYLAKKYNYSQRQINYILDEIVNTIYEHL